MALMRSNTTFLLTNLLHHLATMPDLRARLVREPGLTTRETDT